MVFHPQYVLQSLPFYYSEVVLNQLAAQRQRNAKSTHENNFSVDVYEECIPFECFLKVVIEFLK